MSNNWSAPADWETVCKRAAGRRRYNSVRAVRRAYRRLRLAELLNQYGAVFEHGIQARAARELGVSRSTVCRDVRALVQTHAGCPGCGSLVPREPMEPTP